MELLENEIKILFKKKEVRVSRGLYVKYRLEDSTLSSETQFQALMVT